MASFLVGNYINYIFRKILISNYDLFRLIFNFK